MIFKLGFVAIPNACPLVLLSNARMWASSRVHETVFRAPQNAQKKRSQREVVRLPGILAVAILIYTLYVLLSRPQSLDLHLRGTPGLPRTRHGGRVRDARTRRDAGKKEPSETTTPPPFPPSFFEVARAE